MSLDNLSDREILILTCHKVDELSSDIKSNIKPRLMRLETWKTYMSGILASGGILAGLFLAEIKEKLGLK